MCNAISLPPSAIYRPLNDVDFEKRLTMSKIVKDRIVRDENFGELRLDRDQINKLYNISLEYINGEYTTEQLIDRILKIQGGSLHTVISALGIALRMIILINNYTSGFGQSDAGQMNPHMEWVYGRKSQKSLGYGNTKGPRSITTSELTKTGGSEDSSSPGIWDYKEIMQDLNSKRHKKLVQVEVGHKIYTLTNPYLNDTADELSDKLASQLYDEI